MYDHCIQKKSKPKQQKGKTTLIIVGIVGVVGFFLCAFCSWIWFAVDDTSKSTDEPKKEEVTQDEQSEDNDEVEIADDVEEEKKPDWYNKEFSIDESEFEGMDPEYAKANVWSTSHSEDEDVLERKVVFQVGPGDIVTLIEYDPEYDYCKIKKDNAVGWLACGWLEGLPKDMVDYWNN